MAGSTRTNGQAPNGTVDHKNEPFVNGKHGSNEDGVTKALAGFIVNTTLDAVTPELSTKLKVLLLDYIGVTAAAASGADSTSKILAGVVAFAGSAQGNSTVVTKGSSFAPQYAALLNGALSHSYDFDDTHGPAILHPGCSLISAALAEAEARNSTGHDLLLALVVGYEVACRIGMALGAGSYKHGYHNTGTVGVFGSIAAVCKLRGTSQHVVEDAFGLGLSKAAGSMQFLENGSWNKRLHPGFAAHDALLCVALAEAGVVGASKPLEGTYGAFHNFSSSSDPTKVLTDLGTVWHFLGTACKPFPACRMTHGALEMAGKFRKSHPIDVDSDHDLPVRIEITLPAGNYPIVGLPAPNKIRPQTIVDAQFSIYFQTAAAWLYGNRLGWAIYDKIDDARVLELCTRIVCTAAEVDSYTNLETKIRVTFADGPVAEDEIIYPLAEPQRPFGWETGVKTKFLGLAVPVYGEIEAEKICRLVDGVEGLPDVCELMRAVAC